MPRRLLALLFLTCVVGCAVAQQKVAANLDDFRHDTWAAKEGAPAEIDSMAQGADGWIWLGTSTGLYRFDGVTFSRFVPAAGEYFLGRAISAVIAKPNGDLWIGYIFGTGISVLRDGHLHHLRAQPGMSVGATFGIETDIDGSVWVAAIDGLLRYRQHRWERIGTELGFPGNSARAVFLDQYQRLWVASEHRLLVRDRLGQRFVDVGMEGETNTLAQSPDGRLWQAVGDRLRAVIDTPPGRLVPRAPEASQQNGHAAIFDRDGNLWSKGFPEGLQFRTSSAVSRLRDILPSTPNQGVLDRPWQLASLDTRTLLEDREGNIWLSTGSSLERFRRKKLTVLPFPRGANYFSIAIDRDGTIHAVSSVDRKLWKVALKAPSPAHEDGLADASGGARLVPASAAAGWSAVANAADGDLLLADLNGVERRGARNVRLPFPPLPFSERSGNRITHIADDGSAIWVSLRDRSVFRYAGGRWQAGTELGVPAPVLYMTADGKGGMWFAYKDNRIVAWSPAGVRSYGAANGLDLGTVTFLHTTADGELVAAGSNGLAVFYEGRFRRPRTEDPDLLANVSGLLVTAEGDHWFNAMHGIVHVPAAQWRRSLADPAQPLGYRLFGALQGYPGVNQTSVRSPSVLMGRARQLWFIASAGLVVLEPDRLTRNPLAPPVTILGLRSGGVAVTSQQTVQLPPGNSNVSISYTALGFSAPEQIRFRYRLDGVEAGWQEVGSRRTAYYANLGPGHYRFQVMAANEDGVWSPNPATLDFELAPAFIQTRWFALLCALGVTVIAGLLYASRVRKLTKRLRETLLVRQMERERIARGMHDTLLQSMQGLILRIQGVADGLAGHRQEQRMLEEILDQADHAMHEGRRHVMNLRTAHELAIGLEHALGVVAAAAAIDTGAGAVFSLGVHGKPRPLETNAAEEMFYLLREALLNAFRHADASRIVVTLRYDSARLLLEVSDNGAGIDATMLAQGRPGHFGLAGMRERAQRLGARLVINSTPGAGTVLQLAVPGQLAYRGRERPSLAAWRNWLSALRQ